MQLCGSITNIQGEPLVGVRGYSQAIVKVIRGTAITVRKQKFRRRFSSWKGREADKQHANYSRLMKGLATSSKLAFPTFCPIFAYPCGVYRGLELGRRRRLGPFFHGAPRVPFLFCFWPPPAALIPSRLRGANDKSGREKSWGLQSTRTRLQHSVLFCPSLAAR